MALQEIDLPPTSIPLPREVARFVEGAHVRTEAFYQEQLGLRYPKYIPSDPDLFYTSLRFLQDEGLLLGTEFCEWGCGFAIASGIACLSGMHAVGIEIEDELVSRARVLLDEFDLDVEVLPISYLPEGFDESQGHGGKDLISPNNFSHHSRVVGTPQYDGLDPEEMDLFYVYPWPDQEEMMMDLFEAVSSPGAVLMMYLGDGEMAAFTHAD